MKKRLIAFAVTAGIFAAVSSAFSVAATTLGHHIQPPVTTYTPSDTSASLQDSHTVTLKINGKYLNSVNTSYLASGTTMVPLRDVMETLGWNVSWEAANQSIVITQGAKKIIMQIDSDIIQIDETIKKLPIAPQLIKNVTYIPIRAVSEALGAIVGWEHDNNTAAVYTKNTTSTLTIQYYKAKIGSSVAELTAQCGSPSYKIVGENGLLWYVYATYPSALMAVATDGGIVCGYYTNSRMFSTSDGYAYGTRTTNASKEYQLIDHGDYTIELYYDKKSRILCGINYMLKGFSSSHNINTSLNNQARLGLDILNSFRYSNGKPILEWSIAAAASCADHARYMAEIGKLTHTGADGSSALDRYLKYNPESGWKSWGENICAEASDIFTCINGWINSDYHRSIMLSDKTHAGIGFIYSPTGKYKYCTAMFLYK